MAQMRRDERIDVHKCNQRGAYPRRDRSGILCGLAPLRSRCGVPRTAGNLERGRRKDVEWISAILRHNVRDALYYFGFGLLLPFVALSCFFSLLLSQHGFSGYDVSPMIDSGWRVFSGQVPGRDFIVTFPASLYLSTAASFYAFGVTWRAIALGDCVLYVAVCLLGMRLASMTRGVYGNTPALLLAAGFVGAQTILLISINYLWHSSLAESFAVYAVLATFVTVSVPRAGWVRAAELFLHLTLAFAALLLSKPNTAFLAILLCFAVLVRARTRMRRIGGVLAGALVLSSLALASVHVNLLRMLGAYGGLTGRLVPRPFVINILYAIYARNGLLNLLVYSIVGFTAAGVIATAWRDRRGVLARPVDLLAVGSIAVSVVGMGTNFDYKLTDTPLLLMGMLLYAVASPSATREHLRQGLIAVVTLCLVAAYAGVTRMRMQSVGLWADDKCGYKVRLNDRFFGSLKVCVVVSESMKEVDGVIAALGPGKHVFFGPSMEFLYARELIASPLHLPNWWDPGSSFPVSREGEVVRAWERDHFDTLIFLHDDQAQIPNQILDDIRTEYVPVPGKTTIDVFVRR